MCDLAWVCGRSDKLVSHHLRVLRTAGLVESRREQKMVMYSMTVCDGKATRLEIFPQREKALKAAGLSA